MNFIDQVFVIIGIVALLIVCAVVLVFATGKASITISHTKPGSGAKPGDADDGEEKK